jgi:hypothetical protein
MLWSKYAACPLLQKSWKGKWKALNKAYCLTFNFYFVGITIVVGFHIYLFPKAHKTCTVGSVSFSGIKWLDRGARL